MRSPPLLIFPLVVCAGCVDLDKPTACASDPTKCDGFEAGSDSAVADTRADADAADSTKDADSTSDVTDATPEAETCPLGTCVKVTGLATTMGNTNCALLADGTVACWGWNSSGQVGDGGGGDRSKPVVIPSLSGAVSISIGLEHACAVLGDQSVSCWGKNDVGQLGDGSTTTRPVPTATGLTNVKAVAVGETDTCALLLSETVKCWGAGTWSGDGTTTPHSTPTDVPGISAGTDIVASRDTVCVRKSSGAVTCWGGNRGGVIGTGDTTPRKVPTAVSGTYSSLAMAYDSVCGLAASDGHGVCWGNGAFGQFGYTTTGFITTPAPAPVYDGAKSLVPGANFICAIRPDNTLVCAGRNDAGQLGDGTKIDHSTPQAVPTASGVTLIRAGMSHACMIDSAGLRCWGGNSDRQVGDGTGTDRAAPTLVAW